MTTDLRNLRYGIEIETVGRTRQSVALTIQSIVGGSVLNLGDNWAVTTPDGRTWKIVKDGSLNTVNGVDYGAEVVSPICTYADLDTIQTIVRALQAAGARADASCGIHIHVDAGPFDGRTLGNLMQLVYAHEQVITKSLAVSDNRLRRFCKPVDAEMVDKVKAHKPTSKEAFAPIWYGDDDEVAYRQHEHYDGSRYHGLNLHAVWSKGTVEFRYFNGTLHAGKVKAYIQFVLALAAHALNAKTVRTEKKTFSPDFNHKYDFRCFLLRLGLIGDEFKTARYHLLALLPGDGSHK